MNKIIRIAIGTEPRTIIAQKVLEYSILSQTKSVVNFYPLMGEDYYDRGNFGEGTGFSLLRFGVPELFNYKGGAIYLDADMLVLTDIAELWNLLKDPKPAVWCTIGNENKNSYETSVMLINCQKAKDTIKTIEEIKMYLKDDVEQKKYREIMKLQYLKQKPTELSRWWNVMDKRSLKTSLNDFSNPRAKLLHFTDVRKQPWNYPDHPKKDIWGKWLKKAIKDDYILMTEVKDAISKYDISNPRRPNGLHISWEKYILGKK